jgi:hypothetical protein
MPNLRWKLWLDDQLDDPATPVRHVPKGAGWVGAKSVAEAKQLVEEHGCTEVMDLVHDLGESDALELLKWMSERYPAPEFSVHSRNPVGAERIRSFMKSWARAAEV